MFSRDKAEQIAKDFLQKCSPYRWNGKGDRPALFDIRIVTYDMLLKMEMSGIFPLIIWKKKDTIWQDEFIIVN